MNLTQYFSFKRFWLLLKMELFRSRRGVIMTVVITFGLLFFVGLLLTPIFEPDLEIFDQNSNFAFPLLVGGFILSSIAFPDLGSTLKRYHYLTLPVSALEKFICMWLLTSIGWIISFTLIFTLYSWFANIIGPILFRDITFLDFEMFGNSSRLAIKYYFVLQGIFLVGASRFKAYVLPKTLFSLIIFGVVCATIGYFILADLFNSNLDCNLDTNPFIDKPIFKIWHVLQWLFWWALAPVCWVLTYIGLTEKEA